MTDPLSLLSLALAAANGSVDGVPCRQLIGAGITLLQRATPVVHALAGRRAALVLAPSTALVVGLAAATGHGALLVTPDATLRSMDAVLRDAQVGAVFTVRRWIDAIPIGMPYVLLDDAPRSAHIVAHQINRTVDLGSHFGLALEGDPNAEGLDEECIVVPTSRESDRLTFTSWSHRMLLAAARHHSTTRAFIADAPVTAIDSTADVTQLVETFLAPLLAGAAVRSALPLRDDL